MPNHCNKKQLPIVCSWLLLRPECAVANWEPRAKNMPSRKRRYHNYTCTLHTIRVASIACYHRYSLQRKLCAVQGGTSRECWVSSVLYSFLTWYDSLVCGHYSSCLIDRVLAANRVYCVGASLQPSLPLINACMHTCAHKQPVYCYSSIDVSSLKFVFSMGKFYWGLMFRHTLTIIISLGWVFNGSIAWYCSKWHLAMRLGYLSNPTYTCTSSYVVALITMNVL